MENLKPKAIVGALVAIFGALVWLSSPDINSVLEQEFAIYVIIFTSVVAITSLYFIHRELIEVLSE